MAVVAEKRLQQEKEIKETSGKGKSGKPSGGKSGKGKKGDGKKSPGPPIKSDQPCRQWAKDGTCTSGDSCRYVHAE